MKFWLLVPSNLVIRIKVLTEKKKHNLNFENYSLSGRFIKDLSLGYSFSALSNCSKEVKEETGYIGVLPQSKSTKNYQAIQHRKTTANCKKPRHLKFMNLAFFCAWEDTRVWTYYNHSFDMYLNWKQGQYPAFLCLKSPMAWWQHLLFTEMTGNILCPQKLGFKLGFFNSKSNALNN